MNKTQPLTSKMLVCAEGRDINNQLLNSKTTVCTGTNRDEKRKCLEYVGNHEMFHTED